ncbi:MAG TPA: pyridoxal phosphate-dependent aminotransferase [Pyrinomonadaceae bacterium]|jgi:aminotransferase
MSARVKPDIRTITRLVPPSGNLVQGQSELAIDPALARAAAEVVAASQNHYCPAEGTPELRRAVTEKIRLINGVELDPEAKPLELLITLGATGGLVAVARTHLLGQTALVFEPYYPYHRRIIEELGGRTEVFTLERDTLQFDRGELRARCVALKERADYPLRAIIACTPVNPTGKVFTRAELTAIAEICQELDLLCVADEVYEHYVVGGQAHVSMATLPGMWERTITCNSFSKSWNISGWRLGYTYGAGRLVGPLNNANNVFYVCAPTPLQKALAQVLMAEPGYYLRLRERFTAKRGQAVAVLQRLGFEIYESGSAFYVWARVPAEFDDAMRLNEMLISRAGVAAVPGSAFTDGDAWDAHMRLCIAREEEILQSALGKLERALTGDLRAALASAADH